MKKTLKKGKIMRLVIIIILVAVLLLIGWNKLQEYFFFHPWNDLTSYRKLQKLEEFQEITIKNEEVNLSGWFWNIQNAKEPAP